MFVAQGNAPRGNRLMRQRGYKIVQVALSQDHLAVIRPALKRCYRAKLATFLREAALKVAREGWSDVARRRAAV